MATVMLTGYVSMPAAVLAPGRITCMKLSVLAIEVAMIIAMPRAPVASVPAAMFRAMIARLVAVKYTMLAPARIGRVQLLVILTGIAMEGSMTAARLPVTVARRETISRRVRMPRDPLDLPGALATPGIHPFSPHRAPGFTIASDSVPMGRVADVAPMPFLLLLREGGHCCTGEKKRNDDFKHPDTPDE